MQNKMIFLVTILLGTSCSHHEENPIDNFINSFGTFNRRFCDCFNSWGYKSEQECIDELTLTNIQIGCIKGLFLDTNVNYEIVLDCNSMAYENAVSCINNNYNDSCSNFNLCEEAFYLELEKCPNFSEYINEKLESCLYLIK